MGKSFRTSPDHSQAGWPGGVPYIIGNEAAERFSFYGMKALLQAQLAALYIATGLAVDQANKSAAHDYHTFLAGVYAFPMLGALVADKLLGKYLTIFSLSLVYCAGHGVLAFAGQSIDMMHLGLFLISVGSGGIKPCVGANVGDQFGRANWHLTKKVFQFFYMSVNAGSFASTILTPYLLVRFGADVAFGVPGVLMFVATAIFWAGRYQFVHVPPKPGGTLGLLDSLSGLFLFVGTIGILLFGDLLELTTVQYVIVGVLSTAIGVGLFLRRLATARDDGFLATLLVVATRGPSGARARLGAHAVEGMLAVLRIMVVFLWISLFWALFDQHGSSWVIQAGAMDLDIGFGLKVLPQQTQTLNPALVLILVPLLLYVVFPWIERRGIKITPLRRMVAGMFLAALSFVPVALIQIAVDESPGTVSIWWQAVPYLIITAAEVLVSATGLEFAYSQAPTRMKSTILAFWYLTVSLGNVLAAKLFEVKGLSLVSLFWLFAGLMALAAVLFAVMAHFYKEREYGGADGENGAAG
jgi:POT family proton-dependent oligopeptide transporter